MRNIFVHQLLCVVSSSLRQHKCVYVRDIENTTCVYTCVVFCVEIRANTHINTNIRTGWLVYNKHNPLTCICGG